VHPEWSVWAAYSASNFRNLIIPHAVSRLILCGDSDNKPARDGQGNIKTHPDGAPIYPADEALKRAAQLHADVAADEGRALEVEIWKPDAGEDANSMLQKGTLT
jgi:CDGSH-type Zn-finger protein